MSHFRILCRVSGGVTGDRSGYFKCNGEVVIFDNEQKANVYADQLFSNAKAGERYATASYRYTVEPFMTGDDLLATHRYTGQEALDLD